MSTAAATVAIKKAKFKSKLFHGSSNHGCMCSWKKLETWPATADLDTELPWYKNLSQKVAQHADSNDIWFGVPYRFLAKDDIRKQSSERMVSFRMSIQQHGPRFEDSSDCPYFIISRHHFPPVFVIC
jgi:hypothetical protein